jgi:hypothetical protein
MRTPKNWSRVSLGHPKFGTGCPLEIWLGCQIYGLAETQGHRPSAPNQSEADSLTILNFHSSTTNKVLQDSIHGESGELE